MNAEQQNAHLSNIVQAVNVAEDDWSDLLRVTEEDTLNAWESYDVFNLLAVTVSPLLSWRFGTLSLEDDATGEYLHSAFMPPMTTDMTHVDHDMDLPARHCRETCPRGP